jgi:hypothetical protein
VEGSGSAQSGCATCGPVNAADSRSVEATGPKPEAATSRAMESATSQPEAAGS